MSPNPPYSKWRLIIDWILETKTRRKTKHYAETAESCFLSSPPPLIHELTAHAFFCLVFFCSHHRRPALSHPSSLKKLGRAFFYFTSLVPPTSFRSRVGGGVGRGGGGWMGGLIRRGWSSSCPARPFRRNICPRRSNANYLEVRDHDIRGVEVMVMMPSFVCHVLVMFVDCRHKLSLLARWGCHCSPFETSQTDTVAALVVFVFVSSLRNTEPKRKNPKG